MPTKYILYGGHPKGKVNKRDFYEEMIRDIPKKDIFAVYVPFGKENKEKIPDYFLQNKTAFTRAAKNKQLHFALADIDPGKFLDQIHIADIIYFGGGNDELLKTFLQQIPLDVLTKHFEGKVIAGSSAGANVLATYYYTNNRHRVEEGLGILPIKTICHYTEDKEDKLLELEQYGKKLTSFALPEDYFVVIQ